MAVRGVGVGRERVRLTVSTKTRKGDEWRDQLELGIRKVCEHGQLTEGLQKESNLRIHEQKGLDLRSRSF